MERMQHQREPIGRHLPVPTYVPLIDRIRESTKTLVERRPDLRAEQEPIRLMLRIATDLEQVAMPLLQAVEHCNLLLQEPNVEGNAGLLRDATHLCARVEGMLSQFEDTIRTLERLVEHPAPLPAQVPSGDGSHAWIEAPERTTPRRVLRAGAPVAER